MKDSSKPLVAIACGGTGGHLFPGLAVGEELLRLGCRVQLLISAKEVDQQAVRYALGMETVVLPAIGLTRGKVLRPLSGKRPRKPFWPWAVLPAHLPCWRAAVSAL